MIFVKFSISRSFDSKNILCKCFSNVKVTEKNADISEYILVQLLSDRYLKQRERERERDWYTLTQISVFPISPRHSTWTSGIKWSNSKEHPFSIGSNWTKLGMHTIHIINHVKCCNTQTHEWKYTDITNYLRKTRSDTTIIHVSWNVYSVFRQFLFFCNRFYPPLD